MLSNWCNRALMYSMIFRGLIRNEQKNWRTKYRCFVLDKYAYDLINIFCVPICEIIYNFKYFQINNSGTNTQVSYNIEKIRRIREDCSFLVKYILYALLIKNFMHSIKNEIKRFYLLSKLFRNKHAVEKIIYIVKKR